MEDIRIQAREAVWAMLASGDKGSTVAKFYGIPVQCVYACHDPEYDMGTLNARRVMRVELARLDALKRQERMRMPEAKDRYKGTRDMR